MTWAYEETTLAVGMKTAARQGETQLYVDNAASIH